MDILWIVYILVAMQLLAINNAAFLYPNSDKSSVSSTGTAMPFTRPSTVSWQTSKLSDDIIPTTRQTASSPSTTTPAVDDKEKPRQRHQVRGRLSGSGVYVQRHHPNGSSRLVALGQPRRSSEGLDRPMIGAIVIGTFFLIVTLSLTIATLVFCRKKNTVFVFQKSEQEEEDDDIDWDLSSCETSSFGGSCGDLRESTRRGKRQSKKGRRNAKMVHCVTTEDILGGSNEVPREASMMSEVEMGDMTRGAHTVMMPGSYRLPRGHSFPVTYRNCGLVMGAGLLQDNSNGYMPTHGSGTSEGPSNGQYPTYLPHNYGNNTAWHARPWHTSYNPPSIGHQFHQVATPTSPSPDFYDNCSLRIVIARDHINAPESNHRNVSVLNANESMTNSDIIRNHEQTTTSRSKKNSTQRSPLQSPDMSTKQSQRSDEQAEVHIHEALRWTERAALNQEPLQGMDELEEPQPILNDTRTPQDSGCTVQNTRLLDSEDQ